MNIHSDEMDLSEFLGLLLGIDPERVCWLVLRSNRHGGTSLAILIEGSCPGIYTKATTAAIRENYVGYTGLCLDSNKPKDEWLRQVTDRPLNRSVLRRSDNLRPR